MNGTTIPTGRDNTYTPAETVPAVKTGRAVFVDSEKYESDTAYKARVDKYVAEGFYMVTDGSVSEGSSGGNTASAGALLVEVTINPEDDVHARADKTFGEIKEAIFAGRPVYFYSPTINLALDIESPEGSVIYFPLLYLLLNAGDAAGGVILSDAVIDGLFADTDDDYPSYSESAGIA